MSSRDAGTAALALLLALAPVTARAEGSRMTGRVVDSGTQEPIAGATIELANVSTGQGFFRARTDRSGAFAIDRIAPNRYYALTVTSDGYADFILGNWQFPSAQRAADLLIPLDRAGTLEVRAVRGGNATPVDAARVTIRSERPARWWEGYRPPPPPLFTGRDGIARFVDLEAGSYTVTVEYSDLLPSETRQVRVRPGETTRVPANLVRGARLEGTVRLPDGSAVAGVTVTARGPAQGVGTSDADGAFAIEGLPPGRYRLDLSHEGFEPSRSRETIALREGEARAGIELPAVPRAPEFALVLQREAFVPGTPMAVGLRAFRVQRVEVALRAIPAERLLDPARDFRDLARGGDPAGLTETRRWEHLLAEGAPYAWREEQIRMPDSLAPGAYLLAARGGALERRVIFFVTDLGLLVKRSPTRTLVSAATLGTGAPVPDAVIHAVSATGPRGKEGAAWSAAIVEAGGRRGVTDARGLAELPIDGAPQRVRIVAMSATHGVSVAESPLAPAAESGGDRAYLYTERPIYRPGQTVYWKAIARKGVGDGYAMPDAVSATMSLLGPDGASVEVDPSPVSPWGSADGSVTLPAAAPLGEWRLSAQVGRASAGATFAVQEYRKPEFRVEVTPDREVYVNGDEMRFVVAANYFFGAPVFGAAVRYNLFESRLKEEVSDEEGEEGPRPGFGRVLKTGEARTDIDGRLALSFTPARAGYDRRLTLEVEVVDAGSRVVSGRGSCIVGRGLFTVSVRPTAALVLAGQAVGIEVLTRDHLGKPVVAEVTLELDQDAWSPLERRYLRSTRPLASTTASTDARGRALVSLAPSPARAGYLQIRARADDARGNRITAEGSVWIYDARVTDYAYRYPTLEAFADRERYAPGDTARILVNTDAKNAVVLATVEGRELADVRVVTLAGNTGLVSVPIRAEYAPTAWVSLHLRRGKEVRSRTLKLDVATARHDLAIRLEPDRAEYRPGDAATVRVETRDAAGKPVPSEVSLGAVDEAIYSLRADDTPDPHEVFYGPRPNWVTTVVSFPLLYYGGADKGREEEVRKDFRDVALWAPSVTTDSTGRAEVPLRWPDNLTIWRLTSRGATAGTLVGQATARALVTKPLVARLALPRHFVAGDEAAVLSVVTNRARDAVSGVRESIEARGAARATGEAARTRDLPAGGESRAAWRIAVARELSGDSAAATFTFRAAARDEADAVELTTPVIPRAVPLRSRGAGIVEGAAATATVALPADLVGTGSAVVIECAPSPAAMCLGAVEYLADFPYGCSEQTANAIIPATALIEASRRSGQKPPGWESPARKLAAHLDRLVALRSPMGGWGWWREGETDPYLTALALDALARAARLGIAPPQAADAMWQGARAALMLLDEVRSEDGQAYVAAHLAPLLALPDADEQALGLRAQVEAMLVTLQASRDRLGTAALALAAVAQSGLGHAPQAKALVALLQKRAVSAGGETRWPAEPDAYGWFGEEEETAGHALSAIVAASPDAPEAAGVVRWLASRRSGGHWRSTRTTGPVATALAAYLAARPEELRPDYRTTVRWNGETVLERAVTPGDVFGGEAFRVRLPGSKLKPGANRLEIAKEGRGTLYFSWGARSLVPSPGPSTAGEARLAVTREFLRAERTTDRRGRPRILAAPLRAGEPIHVGEAILVRLTLRADRRLGWLLVEDPRPAGFEVSELLPAGAEWPYGTHAEQRDDRNVFFIEEAEKGETVIEYLVRPELSGAFTALPATASGMYLPELAVRSKEDRLTVAEP